MASTSVVWAPADYRVNTTLKGSHSLLPQGLAELVHAKVCRVDFQQPGFAVVDFGPTANSAGLRAAMVQLKETLNALHQKRFHKRLVYLSMGRFDQQVTTKAHLDGGPPECLLMLGYEPTAVVSKLSIADYSRCAYDLNMTPETFLESLNPMFAPGREALAPYTTEVTCMDRRHWQIVLINNSRMPKMAGGDGMLGVMHQADIPHPIPSEQRIINSTMIGVASTDAVDSVSPLGQQQFLTSNEISQAKYT